ncbi:MAG TPA: TIGR02757 family protein [Bacteroidales bacterium]|nr:TIGR02757 family protein [Bacteroidales bacterium]
MNYPAEKFSFSELKELLDEKYEEYNNQTFIEHDPVSVPHLFTKKEDIEIAGFISASLAWGQRSQILRSAKKLMQMMDYAPYDFITHATKKELDPFRSFIYRTFNGDDCRFFVLSLRNIYLEHQGLEKIFTSAFKQYGDLSPAIESFRNVFLKTPHLHRCEKHIASPLKNSACKRINLFLRWMIRSDDSHVDFGIWKEIPPNKLYCPLDVHTGHIARELGLLKIKTNNWPAVEMLTDALKKFDPQDPVKYDFALFGLGINKLICSKIQYNKL